MLFTSAIFIFFFLPVVLGVYLLLPKQIKNLFLTLASLVFYAWGEKWIVIILMISTIADFSFALLIEKGLRRTGLILSLLVNLSLLGFFKYFNFTFENFRAVLEYLGIDNPALNHIPNIALPVGISFYTFQTLSYTIDVYRDEIKANHNFFDYAAFVTMFPQLIAGPIVRYADIQNQLKNREINIVNFTNGVQRFIIGLAKKMIIANSFATSADMIFTQVPHDVSSGLLWFGAVAYVLQLYYDFSGYSDMAIGLGWMLGFRFPENFNYPYIAKSVREIWQRWHITLSTWFRDYLYISMGGSRVKKSRIYLNLIVVFIVTGFWHGASWNFLLWGLANGFFIIVERIGFSRLLNKMWTPFQHLYLLFAWSVSFVLFRSPDLRYAGEYFLQMFSFDGGDVDKVNYLSFFIFDAETFILLAVAIVFAMPSYPLFLKWARAFAHSGKFYGAGLNFARFVFYVALFVVSISFISADAYNPFIYFRF